MSSNVTPNSFSGKLKFLRHRASTLAISGAGANELRQVIVGILDAMLLEAGDEYKEEFTHSGPIRGSSPEQPLDMSPNVRHMVGVTHHVQPTQAPVVMIPAGQEPVAERPSIIAQPEGTPPHVQLSQPTIRPAPLPAIPPTMLVGGNQASLSATGETRIVKPGADPIAAMENPELSTPLNQ